MCVAVEVSRPHRRTCGSSQIAQRTGITSSPLPLVDVLLLKQPIMPTLQEAAADLPAALFLFGFLNRVFQGGPAIKYGIEIASLFLLRQVGWTNCLLPSLHYAACFSSERITSFPLHLHAPAGPPPHQHDRLRAHTHGDEEQTQNIL